MIEILPYQNRWPAEFAQIAATLRSGLGPLALRIDHIGSTSVPGLDAKDVIDTQVTVGALSDEVKSALVALGFQQWDAFNDHQPPWADSSNPSDWDKFLFIQPKGQRRINVHVRVTGKANQRYPLLFRDYLRATPHAAEAYARLKRELARQLPDVGTYADTKDPAVDLISIAAEAWAKQTGWQLGPSDA
jgi:GrpB-like predicted nucleotidyltransferase (UPF0157 family)